MWKNFASPGHIDLEIQVDSSWYCLVDWKTQEDEMYSPDRNDSHWYNPDFDTRGPRQSRKRPRSLVGPMAKIAMQEGADQTASRSAWMTIEFSRCVLRRQPILLQS